MIKQINIILLSLLLLSVFLFGFASYHVFFQQPIQTNNDCRETSICSNFISTQYLVDPTILDSQDKELTIMRIDE